MKRTILVGAGVALVAALVSCGGGGSGAGGAVSEEEAKKAFAVGFSSVFAASIGMAFGQEVPGATINEETGELTLKDFNLAEFFDDADAAEELGYTSVSGTVTDQEEKMAAKLTLVGGPVESLEFSIGPQEMQSSEGFTTILKVNGREMELEITPEDMGG